MEPAEIVRRVRILDKTPTRERPIPIKQLIELAGILKFDWDGIVNEGKFKPVIGRKLIRVLEMIENNQLHQPKRRYKIEITPPKPIQKTITRLAFTKNGPQVVFQAVNPNAFPVLDPIIR